MTMGTGRGHAGRWTSSSQLYLSRCIFIASTTRVASPPRFERWKLPRSSIRGPRSDWFPFMSVLNNLAARFRLLRTALGKRYIYDDLVRLVREHGQSIDDIEG